VGLKYFRRSPFFWFSCSWIRGRGVGFSFSEFWDRAYGPGVFWGLVSFWCCLGLYALSMVGVVGGEIVRDPLEAVGRQVLDGVRDVFM